MKEIQKRSVIGLVIKKGYAKASRIRDAITKPK